MLDDFPVILLKSAFKDGMILYTNQYLNECIWVNEHADSHVVNLSDLLSRASLIFYESHIKPNLIEYGKVNEVQVSLIDTDGQKVPVVANLTLKEQFVYWSMHICVARDKLYQELISARNMLEKKSEELSSIARTDPLTGLNNRRAALNDFNKLHRLISRKYSPVVVLLIDIDWFKRINDEHGHDVGDEVLCRLSTILKKHIREVDILARWGGEEFLIVLFDTDTHGASTYTQRLMPEIRKIQVKNEQTLTVSVGIAEITVDMTQNAACLDEVVKRADKALYGAKEKGRDRVTIWADNQ